MDNITRRDNGLVYIADEAAWNEMKRVQILFKLNALTILGLLPLTAER